MLTDQKSWLEATRLDTPAGYTYYLSIHPNGSHVVEARSKIEERRTALAPPATQPPPPAVWPDPPQQRLVERPGFDVYGFDYITIKNTTYSQCVATCAASVSCKALTYSRSAGWCFLKTGAELLIRNADANAAYVAELENSIRVSSITVHPKTDIEGYDYFNMETVDFGGCFAACENDTRCRAFSFVRRKRWCWLKADVGPSKANRRVDSGIK
jgi:hypothetical protein